MKLELRDAMEGTAKAFWALYFDKAFVARLHAEALGSSSMEIVQQKGTVAKGLERTLRYSQQPDMPGPVRKLFGSEVTTVEEGAFDPAAGTWTFTLTPGTMAEKTEMHGSIRLDEGADGVVQVFSLEAKVKIFGAGPVVERFIEKQARDTQRRAVAFMNAELRGPG